MNKNKCFRNQVTSIDLTGLAILGPFPSTIVKSIPIAGNGVNISENMITPE